MASEFLYEDDKLRIGYLPDSPEDHLLYVGDGKEFEYIIQRGILGEMARTSRGGIERMINQFNYNILHAIGEVGVSVDGLHVAICQAQMEENRRIQDFTREHQAQMDSE